MSRTLIRNSIIWHNDQFISDHIIVIEDGKVMSITPQAEVTSYPEDSIIDGQENYALPGFLDVHIHGSNGWDTMDATQEALQGMCNYLVAQGVTSFLPTTMSAPDKNISDAITAAHEFAKKPYTPYLGIHLEGPYLNPKHRGSQPDTHLRAPIRDEYLRWFELGEVKLITCAPELDGGDELIRLAREYGITIALGHSGATYVQTRHAVELGLSQITHTFNGVIGIHHREPGALVAAFENPNITMQIIADGVHVHPAMVKMLVKLVGTERVVMITDAMRAAGLADGDYQLGDVAVTVKQGEARTSAGGLAGSTLTMPNALHNMVRFCDLTLAEVIPMMTRVPAESIGMYPQKGALAVGADADIVLWNDELGVQMTLIAGELVYHRDTVLT